ncbi:MAG: pyridine nucleotide-disulfide oxidoreductase [Nitrospira bacterium SG8_35_1]|nr:MAG: pyridine nucleotide-disulfide oxidoreductase [Nitrospira bacterium SG8_35_1]
MNSHHKIVIIGGGNAGISVAAQLLIKNPSLDIAIVEPSDKHYYQPGWTLVGGGAFDIKNTVRNESDFIPKNVSWIKDGAERFEPENNLVITASGQNITYDFMVVCSGIQLDWHLIRGLPETLGKNGVCSNYSFDIAPYTYECIKNFKGGKALFTQPASLIKCGAAPQKIMYLAADNFRSRGVLRDSEVFFYTGKPGLLRVPEINRALLEIAKRYGINLVFQSTLIEVRGESKEAVFEVTKGDEKEQVTVQYDMLHVAPPMSAPDCIRNSPLAVDGDPLGWVDIDKETLQHNRYKNIFSLGDVANAGDTKTGGAVRKQAPVLVNNLLSALKGKSAAGLSRYNGYTVCPITTGYGKLLLAEFDHDNKLLPTFPFDQTQERYSMWLLIKHAMPWMYWNRILKGKA